MSGLLSYNSDEEEAEEETEPSQSLAAPPLPFPPGLPPGLPAPSLDVQLQRFLTRVTPLVAAVEEQFSHDDSVLSAPSTRWFSSDASASNRTFYFDHSRRVVSWNRPPCFVALKEEVGEERASAAEPLPSPPASEREDSDVVAAFAKLASALDALKAALSQGDEEGRRQCALLDREAAIRLDDWEREEISSSYALSKAGQLLERVSDRSSPASSSAPASSPPSSSSPSLLSEPAAEAAPPPAAPIPAAAQPVTALTRRHTFSVSRPPSQPVSALSSASLPPLAASAAPQSPPTEPPSAARSTKVRRVEAAGAVGVMMSKWSERKAREERESEETAQEQEQARAQRLEMEVRRQQQRRGISGNPNLVPISDDWRRRIPSKEHTGT